MPKLRAAAPSRFRSPGTDAVMPFPTAFSPSAVARAGFARAGKWAAGLFIGGYVGLLGVGVASHAMGFGTGAHPLMYYIVWDMFCGWSAQSYRTHVLAEGESGTWYDAGVGPWDEARPFRPYGDLPRLDYDIDGAHAARLGLNVLRHSAHEPIQRLVVIEEVWPKKYNLPEPHWSARWNVPKDPASYYAVRHVLTAEGRLLASGPAWATEVTRQSLHGNPKVRRLAARRRPLMADAAPTARRDRSAPSFGAFAD